MKLLKSFTILLPLLIVGLVLFTTPLYAVDSDPDNADGIDLHDNTVVKGLVNALSDISSGNTAQVGPIGGLYEGSHTVDSDSTSVAAYTGACVLTSVTFTPMSGNAVANGSGSAQVVSGPVVVTGLSVSIIAAGGDYVELYSGTARGDKTNCKIDVEGGVATATASYEGPPLDFPGGVYAYSSVGRPFRVSYLSDDFIEIYDGTSRGNHTNCKLDIKGSAVNGTIVYRGAPIEFETGIYVHASNTSAPYHLGYRIEDQGE